jgi:hypothetical protein
MTGSMSKGERTAKSAAAVAVVAMAAAGCGGGGGGGVKNGNVTPDSVEKKAHTLAQQTLDAVRPVIGSAAASVDDKAWQQCTAGTPGQHLFEYTYILKLDVPQEQSKAVMDAAKAHFTKEGYVADLPDPKTPQVGATEAHSWWWIGVGVSNGNASMFISIDSNCVFTSGVPKTSG